MTDEVRLVEEARSGAEAAFTTLVERYQMRVRGYLARWVRDRATVDDLGQEVFLAAWRHLGDFTGEVPFGAWLAGIARNQALAHLRTRRRRQAHLAPLDATLDAWRIQALEEDAQRLSERMQELEALDRCLATLPDTQRALVEEHYVSRRTSAAIAQERGQGAGAVRMALLRLRQVLRACLERQLEPAS